LIGDRGLRWQEVKAMRLSRLLKFADMFAELDDFREKNRKA
jgi:hypothetical protein